MSRLKDRTGKRYGRLVAKRSFSKRKGKRKRVFWECLCDCGCETLVGSDKLESGETRSCGCLRREVTSKRRTSHGMSGTPEYETWLGIKSRCCNKVDPAYESYGGRGITICDSWKRSFGNFLRDMGPRPSPSLSIDRINNDEGYSPENCRWATRKTQSRNTRSNTTLVVGGEALTIAEWSEKTGVKAYNISQRICKLGWSPEKAVSTPERHQSRRSS